MKGWDTLSVHFPSVMTFHYCVSPQEFPLTLRIHPFPSPFWSSPSFLFTSVHLTQAKAELFLNCLSQFWGTLSLPNHPWDVCVWEGVVGRDCQSLAFLRMAKLERATIKLLEVVYLLKKAVPRIRSPWNCFLITLSLPLSYWLDMT